MLPTRPRLSCKHFTMEIVKENVFVENEERGRVNMAEGMTIMHL